MARYKRWKNMVSPLDGIIPTPTKEEADKIMSNLPVTKKDVPKFNRMLREMGKTVKKRDQGFLGELGL